MSFSQACIFNNFGSNSQYWSNLSFVSWKYPNILVEPFTTLIPLHLLCSYNKYQLNWEKYSVWLNIQFFFSFLRSTGREYALKIIKKSKCRGKVSTIKYETKGVFFQEMFWEAVDNLCPSWQMLESLWFKSLLTLWRLLEFQEKRLSCYSRPVWWFSSLLVVHDSFLFTHVIMSSNFHNSRCYRKQKIIQIIITTQVTVCKA